MMGDVIVKAEHVSKRFCKSLRRSLWYGVRDIAGELVPFGRAGRPALRPGEFWALDDVSFELRRGEALGIIGPNGAGKSTLLKMLNGLLKPDAGRISMRGRAGALIELGAGFNPILTGRENVYINAAVLGLSRRQVDEVLDQIIDFAGIGDFIDAPVQNYSSGMWVRLAFAVAAHLNPQVLLVDEVLAVGDMTFQRKCIQHMMRYLHGGGAIVLVTHNMYLMQSVCSRSLLLDTGQVLFLGTGVEGVSRYFEMQSESLATSQPIDQAAKKEKTPLVIERIEVRPPDSMDEVQSGNDAQIILSYWSTSSQTRVVWGFTIWTADQHIPITGAAMNWDCGDRQVVEGHGQLCCTLRALPLIAGTYTLKAAIVDWQTRVRLASHGYEDTPTVFRVKSTNTETENFQMEAGCLVKITVDWDK